MENEIISTALTQGIWATLSVVLIFYILKAQERRDIKQEEREENYQKIINQLTDRLNTIKDIQDDIIEIKKYVHLQK